MDLPVAKDQMVSSCLFSYRHHHHHHFNAILTLAAAVNETWFTLGVQVPNYIFVTREQYQTTPDICTSLILIFIFAMLYNG